MVRATETTTTSAAVISVPDTGSTDGIGALSAFRRGFYDCLHRRAAALFELTDSVLCADGPVHSLVGLSLAADLRPIVAATAAHPTLRALRPWISHGTLHLLHPDYISGRDHRGVALHPFRDNDYQVHTYGGPTGPAEDPASAATRAATAAAAW